MSPRSLALAAALALLAMAAPARADDRYRGHDDRGGREHWRHGYGGWSDAPPPLYYVPPPAYYPPPPAYYPPPPVYYPPPPAYYAPPPPLFYFRWGR